MNEGILRQAVERFALQQDRLEVVESHEGGRNLVFRCEGAAGTRYLRLSCMNDRSVEDYLSETEFVHYLAQHGAPVADALPSINGCLVEVIGTPQGTVYASLFEEAVGDWHREATATARVCRCRSISSTAENAWVKSMRCPDGMSRFIRDTITRTVLILHILQR